jgi:transketolase
MIACKTIIGFGFPTKAGTQKAHSDAPGEEEIAGARKILGWDSPPFVVPEPLLREWREIGAKGRSARMAWADRVKKAPAELRSEFERRNEGRPSIRLGALMQIRTIFVMTHDSIGLGEDGPTHQPVEQLAALRAVPYLAVYRPGDPVETAECWEAIMDAPRRAALIALSRQPMPLLRRDAGAENRSARGAYVLQEADGGPRQLTLMATGSELHLAVEAREALQKEGVRTAVVSMPCRFLFEQQPPAYRRAVLGDTPARVAVEAGVELSWGRYLGLDGRFVGMHEFGASGKIGDVYKKFDITTEAVIRVAREVVAAVGG